jgi:hypothetical protein
VRKCEEARKYAVKCVHYPFSCRNIKYVLLLYVFGMEIRKWVAAGGRRQAAEALCTILPIMMIL